MIQKIPVPRVCDLKVGDRFMFGDYGMEFKVMDRTVSKIYYSSAKSGRSWESVGVRSQQRIHITGWGPRKYKSIVDDLVMKLEAGK